MCRLEHHVRRGARFERFDPAVGAKAPLVVRLQAGEPEGRLRRREVVAGCLAERQELGRDARADDVDTEVVAAGVAAAVAIEPRQRVERAGDQLAAEHVLGHQYETPVRASDIDQSRTAASASRARFERRAVVTPRPVISMNPFGP